MSVKSLIDEILPYAPGYNRTGTRGLLALIQKAQDFLFDYDAHYMRRYSTNNEGWQDYLKTTAGTFKYDITALNLGSGTLTVTLNGIAYNVRCQRVLKVFIDVTAQNYTHPYVGEPYLYQWQNPYTNTFKRIFIADVAVESTPALESTAASVTFKADPGTYTNRYFIEFVWEPPRLTSEQIPLVVPVKYEEAIEEYVMGTIQKRQNGRAVNDRLQTFWGKWVPEFRQQMETGIASTTPTQTMRRFC